MQSGCATSSCHLPEHEHERYAQEAYITKNSKIVDECKQRRLPQDHSIDRSVGLLGRAGSTGARSESVEQLVESLLKDRIVRIDVANKRVLM